MFISNKIKEVDGFLLYKRQVVSTVIVKVYHECILIVELSVCIDDVRGKRLANEIDNFLPTLYLRLM